MPAPPFDDVVTDLGQLQDLYRTPSPGSVDKESDHLDETTRDFIAASPFCLVGTADPTGRTDVSPKGGDPGFVKVLDENRLVIPDLNGNNRLDSLRNIVANPHVGLLFLVPEEGATLRVKGQAWITTSPAILELFAEYRRPTTAIAVQVETVYMHCAKCIRRSGLWQPNTWGDGPPAPTGTDLLMSHLGLDGGLRERLDTNLEQSYVEDLARDRPSDIAAVSSVEQ